MSAQCQRAAVAADVADPPASEPDVQEPTPFPADKLFKVPMERFLVLLHEEDPDEEALLDAMEGMIELQDFNRQWVVWPPTVAEARRTPYGRGLFKTVCGILRFIEDGEDELQEVATDLLNAFLCRGSTMTRVKSGFLVECGVVKAIRRASQATGDRLLVDILTKVSQTAPLTMIEKVVKDGAPQVAIEVLEDEESEPLEQLAAVQLLASLAKKAPVWTAESGAYEAVMNIDNPALESKRNKVMELLRPVRTKDDEDVKTKIASNLKVGGIER